MNRRSFRRRGGCADGSRATTCRSAEADQVSEEAVDEPSDAAAHVLMLILEGLLP